MARLTVDVTGMSCGGCEQNVEDALGSIAGITSVDADHESDIVEVTTEEDIDDSTLHSAIEDAGYEVPA